FRDFYTIWQLHLLKLQVEYAVNMHSCNSATDSIIKMVENIIEKNIVLPAPVHEYLQQLIKHVSKIQVASIGIALGGVTQYMVNATAQQAVADKLKTFGLFSDSAEQKTEITRYN